MDSAKSMVLEHVDDTALVHLPAKGNNEDRVCGTRAEVAKLKALSEIGDKLNGELKTVGKAGMTRARSRSKSPRCKSPDTNKAQVVKEKKSPVRKPSPSKKKADNTTCESKPGTKRAAKRKAKDESQESLENVNDTADDPKPTTKKPKKKAAPVQKANSASSCKPKKKITNKSKNVENPEVESSKEEEDKSEAAGPSVESVVAADSSTQETPSTQDKSSTEVLQNGDLPEQEAQVLNAQVVKKVCKKVSKKQQPQGSDSVVSTVSTKPTVNGPETDTNSQNIVETDSDTVDYLVNGGSGCITDNLVEKKVVKIDDIEITELSDLNSSRESGDEMDVEHLQIEKPQALNVVVSPQPEAISETVANSSTSLEEKFFVCEQPNCLYRGKSRVLLRKHLTHHGIYNCAHCDFFGTEYDALEQHMIANHPQRWGRKKCKKCMRYIRGADFLGHEESCEGKKSFICEVCGKEFKYESLVLDHQKKNHQPFNCTLCEFIGDTRQILGHHVSQVHPKKKPDNHKCKQCEEKFSSKLKLSEHVKTVHGGQVKKNTKVLTEDLPESQTSEIPQPKNLPIVPPDLKDGPMLLPCVNSVRLDIVKPPEALQQGESVPIQSVENVQQAEKVQDTGVKKEEPQTVAPSVIRDQQPQTMLLPSDAIDVSKEDVTLEIKTEEVAVAGEVCNKELQNACDSVLNSSKTELDSSMSDVPSSDTLDMSVKSDMSLVPTLPLAHSTPQQVYGLVPITPKKEERPFACLECPKRFKDQKTLNGHKNTHSKELNFKCDVEDCKLAFKTARLLNFHKKTAHNMDKSVPMHPCEHPDCHLIFKKKGQLKKHEVVHTGERRYLCEYAGCGKAFRHNANLKIHNLLHTGEKPIRCQHCDFACRQKSSLIHHMKTKHKDVEWPPRKKDLEQHQQLMLQSGAADILSPAVVENNNQMEDGKSELDTSAEQVSESDISGNTSSEPQQNTTTNTIVESPAYPKILSTPTKAMVKAMAPGFLMNTPGFDKSKPISPISATPSLGAQHISNADIYDFNEEDSDTGLQVSFAKKQQKSPGRPTVVAGTSSLELLQAMEPVNLSNEAAPGAEEIKVVKKKRSPRKKKVSIDKMEETDVPVDKVKIPVAVVEPAIIPEQIDSKPQTPEPEVPEVPEEKTEEENKKENDETSDACPDDMVEDHVSENVPLSVASSVESVTKEEESEMEMDEPVAVPAQPEPYPDPVPPQPELVKAETEEKVEYDEEITQEGSEMDMDDPEEKHERITDERESDIPEDVENLALERGRPPSRGLLDMPSPEKRDSSIHSFDLPHDIDPDEAAKLLEESGSFDEDPKEAGGHHEVSVIMPDAQSNKDDILPSPRPQHTDNMNHSHEQGSINPEQFDFNSYGQHHPGEFTTIHDLSNQKQPPISTEPESFNDPSQRRPSSSYVPDFLPTMPTTSAGSSGLGPPSVSSSYSSPSYTQAPPSQSDLSNYGAPGSNLPPYTPQSTGVPYMSPTSTPASYPITSSAGISSYPPVTSSSFTTSQSADRTSATDDSRATPYQQGSDNTAVTSSTTYANSPSYQSSRELFGHYFQDPLSQLSASQDPRSLPYSAQQSSLQALQRSSADFLQRASATGLPGMNYPGVSESLARLSQTTTQQPWIGTPGEERSRPWAQASPILMAPDLETASPLNRNPFSSARSEYSGLEAATKRPDSTFPVVPPPQTVPSATERYDVASAYMGSAGHFNPNSTYSKSLTPSVAPDPKQLEEAYRQHSAAHMGDYRSLSQGPPHVTDMYSRMGMNPGLGLDKYYPYSREAVYRSQHIGATTNPFMPPVSTAQMSYTDRDYAARNPYTQDSAYSKYLPAPTNLTQQLPGLQGAPADYLQARPSAPDPYDPYRRSVIHNMMTRYF